VRSAPGLGTTFTVTLPLSPKGLTPGMALPDPRREQGSETILVVEDDEGVRDLTGHHLAASGYRVLQATDAASALECLQATKDPVHLLLTDVVMPGMDGRELAEIVRRLRPEIRVLYMSGYPDDTLSDRSDRWNENVLISKPFDRAKLLSMVRMALD